MSNNNKSANLKQLDDGIGDTFVSGGHGAEFTRTVSPQDAY
jgi:hypothetical protein